MDRTQNARSGKKEETMEYGQLRSGDWIVAGKCSEPRFKRVGKENTPRCTIGIAAGQSNELDDRREAKNHMDQYYRMAADGCGAESGQKRGFCAGDRKAA